MGMCVDRYGDQLRVPSVDVEALLPPSILSSTQQVLMYLDHTIGELVEYLETEGWMENSIIVVASDNGGCVNNGGCNYPLRGTKDMYWEGGSKVMAYSTAALGRASPSLISVSLLCVCTVYSVCLGASPCKHALGEAIVVFCSGSGIPVHETTSKGRSFLRCLFLRMVHSSLRVFV